MRNDRNVIRQPALSGHYKSEAPAFFVLSPLAFGIGLGVLQLPMPPSLGAIGAYLGVSSK